MESSQITKAQRKHKRKLRIRKSLRGTALKPRLCVVKTNVHIHLQLIDDESGKTLANASTHSKSSKTTEFGLKNKTSAKELGLKIAQLAQAKDVKQVILDRGSSKYHGIVAAVADGAREGGLEL